MKSLSQGYGENLRWMLKLSLDLPSPELILLQHGHPEFEISSVITGLLVALAEFAAATECPWYPRGDTCRSCCMSSPSPPTPTAGQREPLLLGEFPIVMQV